LLSADCAAVTDFNCLTITTGGLTMGSMSAGGEGSEGAPPTR
jgi:hypothetical protein